MEGGSINRRKRAKALLKQVVRNGTPAALIVAAARPSATRGQRETAIALLLAYWTWVYGRYRKFNILETKNEYELLRRLSSERDPTVEEEFDLGGESARHRHEMRDIVGEAIRRHIRPGGRVLDIGSGSGRVADRILDVDASYFGFHVGEPYVDHVAKGLTNGQSRLKIVIGRCEPTRLPVADASFDVVVMGGVIEHLIQPELAVWEIARVLRPGGVFVMTTDNASEVPLRSPLSHVFAWLEKAIGADHPELISRRRWISPPEDPAAVHLPHTHHIQAETRRMFAAAGMDTFHWSSFGFPPPQAASARWLEKRGAMGRSILYAIDRMARRTPVVRRLGAGLFMLSRKVREPVSPMPAPGIWPGPFSVQGRLGTSSFK